MCNKCNGNCSSCNCTCNKPCVTPDCACKVFLTTDCVTLTEDLPCSKILKGQTETEVWKQFDAYVCEKFEGATSPSLTNVGTGAEIYKGTGTLGKEELKTLVGGGDVNIEDGENEITISLTMPEIEPELFKEDIVVQLDGGRYLGKYASGQTIPAKDKTFEWVIRDIAIEYLLPAITSFSASVSPLLEVGVPISGVKTFSWTFKDVDNVKPNTVDILNASDNSPLSGATNISNTSPATANIGTISNIVPISKSWRLRATNTNDVDFTTGSSGNAADYTINTIYPIFYGNSDTKAVPSGALVASGIKDVVRSSGTISANFNDNIGKYHWFAIPVNGGVEKTKWWNSDFDTGDIGGTTNYYGSYTIVQVTSPDGLWSNIDYKVCVSNQAAKASITEFRN